MEIFVAIYFAALALPAKAGVRTSLCNHILEVQRQEPLAP